MTWNDDRVARLTQLWNEGHSASEVACIMGDGLTRNSVISKIHRLGLPTRDQDAKQKLRRGARKPRPAALQRAVRATSSRASHALFVGVPDFPPTNETDFEAPVEIEVPEAERKKLVDLEQDDCRWPIGDPRDANFHFCNRTAVLGKPYCAHHVEVAFEPARVRTRHAVATIARQPVKETVDA